MKNNPNTSYNNKTPAPKSSKYKKNSHNDNNKYQLRNKK